MKFYKNRSVFHLPNICLYAKTKKKRNKILSSIGASRYAF